MKELQIWFMLWRRKAYRARQSEGRRDSQAKPGIVSGECAEPLWGNKMFSQLSRLVGLIDELESQGLVERRAHETDRRSYALHLTEKGKSTMESIGRIAREHRQDLLAALSEEEQKKLAVLLATRCGTAGLDQRSTSRIRENLPGEENEAMTEQFPISNISRAHRSAITGHCYRMLGSFFDAEDATQEAMIRAWKGLDRFDGRASLKNWLYRIATNVCLDEIHNKGRRARPMEEGSAVFRHAFGGGPGAASRERVD